MNNNGSPIFRFDVPWYEVEEGNKLENQLYIETGEQHPLFGKKVKAIARRHDRDDVLFFIPESNEYAFVHLTLSSKPLDKNFPSTKFAKDLKEVQKKLDEDVTQFIDLDNAPLNETGGFVEGHQRIIIVGASSGIGRELAKKYALEGNVVGVTGRRTDLLQELTRSFKGRIIDATFDVTADTNKEQLEALIKRLGGLDLLIISAGTGEPSKDLDWEIDRTTVQTNVNGFVEIANRGFNYFVQQGKGHLVVISSIAAVRGGSWAPAYNASKAFQSSYFEGLAFKAAKMKKQVYVT